MPREEYHYGLTENEVNAIREAMTVNIALAKTESERALYRRLEKLFTI